MSEARATLYRLIDRDLVVRKSKEIHTQTAQRILSYATDHSIFGDKKVHDWCRAIAETRDYWLWEELLKYLGASMRAKPIDEDVDVFVQLLRPQSEDHDDFFRRISHVAKHGGLTEILSNERAIAGGPGWGSALVALQDAVLFAHQRDDWPEKRLQEIRLGAALGTELDEASAFTPEYDDHPETWFYRRRETHDRDDARVPIGEAILQLLRHRALLAESQPFDNLAESLITSPWALAITQPLVALLDTASGKEGPRPWTCESAVTVLSREEVIGCRSAWPWRRLVRGALGGHFSPQQKVTLTVAVRESSQDDLHRINELADLQAWGTLTEEEQEQAAETLKQKNIYPATDPRERLRPSTYWGPVSRDLDELSRAQLWPYEADREAFRALENDANPPDDTEELRAWAEDRTDALGILCERVEAFGADWIGDTAYWAAGVLESAKVLEYGPVPTWSALPSAESYLELLDRDFPWWERMAVSLLSQVSGPVPEGHHDRKADNVYWGSNETFYAALRFLDVLLVADDFERLAELRSELAASVVGSWADWPSFTRMTALIRLRPSNWQRSPELYDLLDRILGSEEDPEVLKQALEVLLRTGSKRIAGQLQVLLMRIRPLKDHIPLANVIGQVLGNAHMRKETGQEDSSELASIAGLARAVVLEGKEQEWPRGDVLMGLLDGMASYLKEVQQLTSPHAAAWCELGAPAAHWLAASDWSGDRHPHVLEDVFSVLELEWGDSQLRVLWRSVGEDIVGAILRAELSEFHWLHYDFKKVAPRLLGLGSEEEQCVEVCAASANRVAEWRQAGLRTNDLGYVHSLTGTETGQLVSMVFRNARDRERARRLLPKVIDTVAQFNRSLAAELRVMLRKE